MSHAHGKAAKAALARMKKATNDMSTAGGKRPMASSDPPKAKKPADEEPAEVRAKTRTKAEEESYSCPAATVSLLGEREPPTWLTDPGPPARSQVEPPKETPQAEEEDKSKWVHEGILEVKQPLQGGKQGGQRFKLTDIELATAFLSWAIESGADASALTYDNLERMHDDGPFNLFVAFSVAEKIAKKFPTAEVLHEVDGGKGEVIVEVKLSAVGIDGEGKEHRQRGGTRLTRKEIRSSTAHVIAYRTGAAVKRVSPGDIKSFFKAAGFHVFGCSEQKVRIEGEALCGKESVHLNLRPKTGDWLTCWPSLICVKKGAFQYFKAQEFMISYKIIGCAQLSEKNFCLKFCKVPRPCPCDAPRNKRKADGAPPGAPPPKRSEHNAAGQKQAALASLMEKRAALGLKCEKTCPHFAAGRCIYTHPDKRACHFKHVGDASKIKCTITKCNRKACGFKHDSDEELCAGVEDAVLGEGEEDDISMS